MNKHYLVGCALIFLWSLTHAQSKNFVVTSKKQGDSLTASLKVVNPDIASYYISDIGEFESKEITFTPKQRVHWIVALQRDGKRISDSLTFERSSRGASDACGTY